MSSSPSDRGSSGASDRSRRLGAGGRRSAADQVGRRAKRRIPFEFDEEAYARLEALVDGAGAASKAEVVRRALRVYEWLVTESKAGHSIALLDPDGETIGRYDLRVIT